MCYCKCKNRPCRPGNEATIVASVASVATSLTLNLGKSLSVIGMRGELVLKEVANCLPQLNRVKGECRKDNDEQTVKNQQQEPGQRMG